LIDQLVDRRLVRSLPDLYRLNRHQLVELEHIGNKSAQNLLEAINGSKDRGLARVLTGLGIRHVGERNARLLAEEFGNIDALMNASEARLARIPGVGPVVAHSVYQFFHSETGRKTVAELRALGVNMTEKKAAPARDGKLAGRRSLSRARWPGSRATRSRTSFTGKAARPLPALPVKRISWWRAKNLGASCRGPRSWGSRSWARRNS
jgi:DNA ligase (NAD+)